MKKNIFGIIGALLFVAAVIVGYFANFPGDTIVQVGLAAFGLCSVVLNAILGQKEKGELTWKTILAVCLAVAGGLFVAIGGYAESIFSELSGCVLIIITVILSIINTKKSE